MKKQIEINVTGGLAQKIIFLINYYVNLPERQKGMIYLKNK
jgi:hypothetical protein